MFRKLTSWWGDHLAVYPHHDNVALALSDT